MNEFEHNIVSIYKENGTKWLKTLPQLVEKFAKKWDLTQLKPVQNLSFNYVLAGYQNKNPIILKICPTSDNLSKEIDALKVFAGYGGVKILAYENDVILLERAVSGHSLKTYLPMRQKEALIIICKIMKNLHTAPFKKYNFPNIKEWMQLLDQDWPISTDFLVKARTLKNKLLLTYNDHILLHGDLHHDNILENKKDFVVIDPKGIIGSSINETCNFIRDPIQDTEYIANYFNFNLQELREWYFTHLILKTCWNLEDHLDPGLFLSLAAKTYTML